MATVAYNKNVRGDPWRQNYFLLIGAGINSLELKKLTRITVDEIDHRPRNIVLDDYGTKLPISIKYRIYQTQG